MGLKKLALSGQLADVDIKLLRVYRAVVEAGGISPAEVTLNLANSTITNYLADLEKRLSMHLCERGRKGFSITAQGQLVYDASLELFSALNQFRQTINSNEQRLFGHLQLAIAEHTLGAPEANIIRALHKFGSSAPDVQLEIQTNESDQVSNAILSNGADIGITVAYKEHPQLSVIELFEEEMLLYASIDHNIFKQRDSQIDEHSLLNYAFVESPRLLSGRLRFAASKQWTIKAKAHNQEARLQLILSGHYIGFLPRHLVQQWGVSSLLKPILINQFSYTNTFKLLYNQRSSNKILIEHFISCLQATS